MSKPRHPCLGGPVPLSTEKCSEPAPAPLMPVPLPGCWESQPMQLLLGPTRAYFRVSRHLIASSWQALLGTLGLTRVGEPTQSQAGASTSVLEAGRNPCRTVGPEGALWSVCGTPGSIPGIRE